MTNDTSKNSKNTQAAKRSGTQGARRAPQKSAPRTAAKAPTLPVKITFLGGLNEIGKNITMIEYGNDALLIDCGMSFPDEDMPGVDIVLADYTWVERNKDRIRGILVTHGHEDHIGGLPYLLKQVNLPIYAAKLTLALIRSKLSEHGLANSVELHEVKAGTIVTIPFPMRWRWQSKRPRDTSYTRATSKLTVPPFRVK